MFFGSLTPRRVKVLATSGAFTIFPHPVDFLEEFLNGVGVEIFLGPEPEAGFPAIGFRMVLFILGKCFGGYVEADVVLLGRKVGDTGVAQHPVFDDFFRFRCGFENEGPYFEQQLLLGSFDGIDIVLG